MSTKEIPENELLLQDADSTAIILQPVIDVPEKIELKVERPSIQRLQVEDTVEQEHARQVAPSVAREAEVLEMETEDLSEDLYEGPDTLDFVLISQWQSSGFSSALWTSEQNDSVCFLPADYYSGASEATDSGPGGQIVSNIRGKGDLNKSKTDSLDLAEKAVESIETVEIPDPEPMSGQWNLKPLLGQDWFLVVIIGLVTLTGFLRFKWHKYLSDVFSAVLFTNVAGKLQNTTGGSQKTASFWLEFLFYTNFALLFFEFLRLSERTFFYLTDWKLLLTLLGFLVVIFTLKFIVYRFVGWVFGVQASTKEYLFQSSVMSKAFGLILLPLVVVFPFLEPEARHWIPRIGFSVFILLYVIQIGRGIGANFRNALSGYYIFLYLCALEILPLSILYKVLFY
jgi:hypothetical protein